MYCKNCGKEVSNDDRFCEYCGYATGDSKETVTEKKKANRKKIIVIVAAALAVAIAVGIFLAWKSFMIGGASSREGAFKKMVQANIDEDYEALNMMTFPKKYEDEYFSFLMAEYGISKEDDEAQMKTFMSQWKLNLNNVHDANIVSVENVEISGEKMTEKDIDNTLIERTQVEYFLDIGIIDDMYGMVCDEMNLKDENGDIYEEHWMDSFVVYKIDGRWYVYLIY